MDTEAGLGVLRINPSDLTNQKLAVFNQFSEKYRKSALGKQIEMDLTDMLYEKKHWPQFTCSRKQRFLRYNRNGKKP